MAFYCHYLSLFDPNNYHLICWWWSAHFFDLFANFDFCGNIPQFQIVCFRICESKSQIYLNSNIIQGVNTSVHMNSQNISPKIYGNAALHNEVAMPYYFLNGLDSSDDTHSATNLLFHADHDSSSFIFSIQIFFSRSAAQSKNCRSSASLPSQGSLESLQ